jgi:acyl-CoA thioesterase-2
MSVSLTDLLDLETLDINLFRSRFHRENFRNTLFGGQVLGQSLMAAARTCPDRLPHSMHAYFLRAGNSDTPVIYDVESVRDGQSFSARRVVARQQGRPIFNMAASFHKEEPGYHHAAPMPKDIPPPEQIMAEQQQAPLDGSEVARGGGHMPFQFVPVDADALMDPRPRPAHTSFWLRSMESLPDSPIHHYCALAYASDVGLLATALLPHNTTLFEGKVIPASVDHAMWFHTQDFRVDEWLLYVTDSPWAGFARGFTRGALYTRQGQLVASTTQEGLLRPT